MRRKDEWREGEKKSSWSHHSCHKNFHRIHNVLLIQLSHMFWKKRRNALSVNNQNMFQNILQLHTKQNWTLHLACCYTHILYKHKWRQQNLIILNIIYSRYGVFFKQINIFAASQWQMLTLILTWRPRFAKSTAGEKYGFFFSLPQHLHASNFRSS